MQVYFVEQLPNEQQELSLHSELFMQASPQAKATSIAKKNELFPNIFK
jgi:hypothetical protein